MLAGRDRSTAWDLLRPSYTGICTAQHATTLIKRRLERVDSRVHMAPTWRRASRLVRIVRDIAPKDVAIAHRDEDPFQTSERTADRRHRAPDRRRSALPHLERVRTPNRATI